jgi:hypothetical protein
MKTSTSGKKSGDWMTKLNQWVTSDVSIRTYHWRSSAGVGVGRGRQDVQSERTLRSF